MKTAIITLSKNGAALGVRLLNHMESASLYIPKHISNNISEEKKVFTYEGKVKTIIPALFEGFDALVFIMASGIVVRLIAPYIQSKLKDPAIVVLDENGENVISLLSGHIGGANALTRKISKITKGSAVITTASDIHKKASIDLIVEKLGFKFDNPEEISSFTRSYLDGEPVGIIDKEGYLSHYFSYDNNVTLFNSLDEAINGETKKNLLVSNKITEIKKNLLIVRAVNIIAGIGCKRGVTTKEIEDAVNFAFTKAHLSINSLKKLATIDIKADEEGLSAYSNKIKVAIDYFSKKEINDAFGVESGSDKIKNLIGVKGVCEQCAKLSSGRTTLILPKINVANRITVALAQAVLQ